MSDETSKLLIDSLNRGTCWTNLDCKPAADRIEALEAENARLRDALKQIERHPDYRIPSNVSCANYVDQDGKE